MRFRGLLTSFLLLILFLIGVHGNQVVCHLYFCIRLYPLLRCAELFLSEEGVKKISRPSKVLWNCHVCSSRRRWSFQIIPVVSNNDESNCYYVVNRSKLWAEMHLRSVLGWMVWAESGKLVLVLLCLPFSFYFKISLCVSSRQTHLWMWRYSWNRVNLTRPETKSSSRVLKKRW